MTWLWRAGHGTYYADPIGLESFVKVIWEDVSHCFGDGGLEEVE